MNLVIDMPEDVYNYIKANGARIPYHKLTDAIKKGTMLPKGKWIKQYQNVNGTDFEVQNKVCSECNKSVKYKYPFCPYCGADMRGDE